MDKGDLGVLGALLVSLPTAAAWLGGETGKVMVAGGLGGLTRWLTSERKRIRDGIVAAIGGSVTGLYLWPLGLHLPRLVGGTPFEETASNIALSAFLIGTLGTSAVKIFVAYIEARAAKLTKGGGHEKE
ncbi:hypothetical protein SAMN04244548_03012 [Paracoccus pantotrophus]|nr:hypothetical protein SAMN04244548_03012 [Paracoccus pantotrophus]